HTPIFSIATLFPYTTLFRSYVLDKLEQDRMDIYNEFLTYFGINNVNIQKKERLITNEANANDELIMHNRNKFLKPRKESAKIISELWDREINVGVNEEDSKLLFQEEQPSIEGDEDDNEYHTRYSDDVCVERRYGI